MTDEETTPSNGGVLKERVRRLEIDLNKITQTVDDVTEGLYGVKGDYITRAEFKALADKIATIDKDITALKERLTIFNLAQATFTTIVGAIAAILGVLLR